MQGFDFVFACLAALAAGAVNALAGGGTLITFPMLTFLGVPAVAANVTNTVALCPGYFGGTLAQWKDLRGQQDRLWLVVPASIVGGVLGGFLLLQTGERLFRELVPYLILLASGLLAIQDPVRAWLTRRMGEGQSGASLEKLTWLPVGLASVYGRYFGAGLSVIVLSALGLTLGLLPLLFHLFPSLGDERVGQMPLAWLLLGILAYPWLVLLGWFYIRRAEDHERDFADLVGSVGSEDQP